MLRALRSLPERYGRPATGQAYLAPLDGLRALAIAIVIFWHIAIRVFRLTLSGPFEMSDNAGFLRAVPHGEIGVSLFFFISGFIISRPFLSGGRAVNRATIGRFYRQRVVRIAPPHLILITLSFLALAVAGYRPQHAANFEASHQSLQASYFASLFYLNGLIFETPPRLNPPTWSLEIEMQFYLLAPFIMAVCRGSLTRPANRYWTLGVSVLAALFTLAVLARWGAYSPLRWMVFSYLYLFLLGVGIAQSETAVARQYRLPRAAYDALGAAGLLLLFATGLFRDLQSPLADTLRLSATMMSVLLLFYGAMRGRVLTALLSSRWVALFGAMSYSVYLTHVAIIQAAATILFKFVDLHNTLANLTLATAILFPAVAVAGTAYYIVVERYFMQSGHHSQKAAQLNPRQP